MDDEPTARSYREDKHHRQDRFILKRIFYFSFLSFCDSTGGNTGGTIPSVPPASPLMRWAKIKAAPSLLVMQITGLENKFQCSAPFGGFQRSDFRRHPPPGQAGSRFSGFFPPATPITHHVLAATTKRRSACPPSLFCLPPGVPLALSSSFPHPTSFTQTSSTPEIPESGNK